MKLYIWDIYLRKLPRLLSNSKKEFPKALNLGENITPLAYLLYMNPLLRIKSKEQFYRNKKTIQRSLWFSSRESQISIYREKIKKQETKDILVKKWKQWIRMCQTFFFDCQENFQNVEFNRSKR